MFEYHNDKLIVDEMIIDPSLPTAVVVRIGDSYYQISHHDYTYPERLKENKIRPYKKRVDDTWYRPTTAWQFWSMGLIPRSGYKVDLGRAITDDEFKSICEEFALTPDDISNEFIDTVGAIYGDEYKQTYVAKQIRLPDVKTALQLETRLIDRGIQASNCSPGRLNIRVESVK